MPELAGHDFDGMIHVLARAVGVWEVTEDEDVGRHFYSLVESVVKNNEPEQITYLIGFLCIALGQEGLIQADHDLVQSRAEMN